MMWLPVRSGDGRGEGGVLDMCQLLLSIGVSPASMTECGFLMDLGSERGLRIEYVRVVVTFVA